jgi:hypothetical protein
MDQFSGIMSLTRREGGTAYLRVMDTQMDTCFSGPPDNLADNSTKPAQQSPASVNFTFSSPFPFISNPAKIAIF